MITNFITIIILLQSLNFLISCKSTDSDLKVQSNNMSAITLPFEFIDNRIFVDVFINGKGPFKFIFDTGGSNCITTELANNLSLKSNPIEDVSGAGESTTKAWNTQIDKFQMGAIEFKSQDFLILDFSKIKKAFQFSKFDGIFGFEVLQKFKVKIDYVSKNILFYDSISFTNNDYTKLSFILAADKPVIQVKINNLPAQILIDTGDRSALTIFSNFRKNSLIKNSFKRKYPQITGYGIGGPISAILGKIDNFEITKELKLENVVSRAPTTKGGFNAISNINGSIGNEILKQFDIIFDYQNNFIFFKPNINYEKSTEFNPVPNPNP